MRGVDRDRFLALWERYGPVHSLLLVGVLGVVWVVEVAIFTFLGQEAMQAAFVVTPRWPLERPWSVATNVLGHRDPAHVGRNLLCVVPVGWIAEKKLTRRRWWGLFLVAGGVAGVSQAWMSGNSAVGASGGLAALLAVSVVGGFRWYGERLGYSSRGVRTLVLAAIVGVGGALLWLYLSGADDIGHVSHIVGYALGVVAGVQWLRLGPHGTSSPLGR